MKDIVTICIRDKRVVNTYTTKNFFEDLPKKLGDGIYKVTAEQVDKRSLNQNKYYFKVCVGMIRDRLQERGYYLSKQEVHDMLRFKFNYIEIVDYNTGEIERTAKSTTGLNKDKFSEYIGKVQHYAATSLDLTIPDPGSQMLIDYE